MYTVCRIVAPPSVKVDGVPACINHEVVDILVIGTPIWDKLFGSVEVAALNKKLGFKVELVANGANVGVGAMLKLGWALACQYFYAAGTKQ